MFDLITDVLRSDMFRQIWSVVYYFLYVAVPLFLINTAWDFWVKYRRALFFAKQEYVLLEIKLPREIFKSPAAMEFCIAAMHSTLGEANWYEKYWKGSVRNQHSLEIVSIDGSVHFYIRTKKREKKKIEANIYSQYPGVEIYEVEDYTLPVVYDPEVNSMWVTEFELKKADAFPIKTYIDYGMDKNPEEEYKLDPMTPLIEFLGSLDKGNQVWIQILIRAHVSEERDPDRKWWNIFEKKDLRWKEGAKKEIDDIVAKAKGEKDKDGKLIPGTGRQLTEVEKDTISALDRSVSKKGFDTGIRVIYFALKDVFSMGNVGGVVGGIMHFNSSLNNFAPTGALSPKYKTPLLAWKDRNAKTLSTDKQDFLDAYKRREHFYWPYKRPHFILNTEELATLFHFPGGVSTTPSFTRIESKKAEAPANLPV
ncbi:MAG: hypothetical protein CEO12_136 [Parcubacteria group bacterium Gr01-1014_46]|nr:MAG: hypothetical protein CEO12_136 [Parcubacteria group bacterium Gr01-1014_46]